MTQSPQETVPPMPVGPNGPEALPEPPTVQPVDYFGFKREERYTLPDGVQWIEFAAMNEGAKKKYQQKTSRDFVVDRRTGDTRVSVDPGTEREILIRESVTGWYMLRGGQPVPFNSVQLGDFLTLADPSVIEGIEKAIRDANPWLLDNVTVEDIDKQIEQLEDQKKRIQEREAGEAR